MKMGCGCDCTSNSLADGDLDDGDAREHSSFRVVDFAHHIWSTADSMLHNAAVPADAAALAATTVRLHSLVRTGVFPRLVRAQGRTPEAEQRRLAFVERVNAAVAEFASCFLKRPLQKENQMAVFFAGSPESCIKLTDLIDVLAQERQELAALLPDVPSLLRSAASSFSDQMMPAIATNTAADTKMLRLIGHFDISGARAAVASCASCEEAPSPATAQPASRQENASRQEKEAESPLIHFQGMGLRHSEKGLTVVSVTPGCSLKMKPGSLITELSAELCGHRYTKHKFLVGELPYNEVCSLLLTSTWVVTHALFYV